MAKPKTVAEIVQRMFSGGKLNIVAVRINCILEAKMNLNYLNPVLIFSPFFSANILIPIKL